MHTFIFDSARESQMGDEIKVTNFKLNSVSEKQPSTFEIIFIAEDVIYKGKKQQVVFRYGFQVDNKKVHTEWLFGRFSAQESKLFTRIGDEITIGAKYVEGKQVYKTIGKIRQNSLFLSMIASIKGENAGLTNSIMLWFWKLRDISKMADNNFMGITFEMFKKNDLRKLIQKLLICADIGIEDLLIEQRKIDSDKIPDIVKDQVESKEIEVITFAVHSTHKKYNEKAEEIGVETFDFLKEESAGSQKFLALIGPIITALLNGLVLVVDEIDTHLHPNLCEVLITLFQSSEINKKKAQLIFATHNTLIMNKDLFRRDQIYFVDKNNFGESELYSLFDYKNIRNDAAYDKNYLMGKYGGVPSLGNFKALFEGENRSVNHD